MLLPDLLSEAAASTPGAAAIVDAEGVSTYDALERRSNRYAHLLRGHGLAPGDRVVIALENGVDMIAAYLGAMKAGGIAVPLPAGSRSDRLGPAVADCAPRIGITDSVTAGAPLQQAILAAIPTVFVRASSRRSGREDAGSPAPFHDLSQALDACPDTAARTSASSDRLAAIIYTSGSTGEPRGVMLSHGNFLANARSIVEYLNLTSADRVMCVLPFHYVYGLSLLHTHLMVGGSLVIENRVAFPNVILSSMQQHEVTGLAGVPSTFALLLHRSSLGDVQLPRLRYVTQAGGAMPPARILEWLERGPRVDFYVMYGATEAAARLTYLPPADLRRKLGSIGHAVPGVEVRVVTMEGRPAAAGEVGELVASGPNISAGYWNRADETSERFGPLGYRTGDLGYADEDGFLYLVGRLHDMVKVGAHRVGLREIEDVLHEHPAVSEAAAVAAPDDLLGEVPVAFVTLRAPVVEPEATLRGFAAARLAPYKVPARIVALSEMPRLASGKTDKRALREFGLPARSDRSA